MLGLSLVGTWLEETPMDFDLPNLACSLVFSVIGLGLFRFARKQSDIRRVLVAVTLMGYSYFTPNLAWNLGVGLVLCAAAWYWR